MSDTMYRVLRGDCLDVLRTLDANSVHCCVTSPPYYGLRDYGHDGQIGLEETPDAYVAKLVEVFRAVRRVLRDDGTLWLNLGDSYNSAASGQNGMGGTLEGGKPCGGNGTTSGRRPLVSGIKPKDLIGIPWRVAFALQADGWWLRQDIIWHKPNPMPESVRDRCTKAHEYLFLLSKSERYHYDADAIVEPAVTPSDAACNRWDRGYEQPPGQPGPPQKRERRSVERGGFSGKSNAMPGREAFRAIRDTRNKRSVWTVATKPYAGAHFATFPPKLIEPCILAGCPVGGTVLDPFGGSGTTGMVARKHGRSATLIELNPEYADMAERRIASAETLFA